MSAQPAPHQGGRVDLSGRSFLKEIDFTKVEFLSLVDLAVELRDAKRAHAEHRALEGRNIALIFEKTSTRTRSAFEVAAHDQGAHVSYLGPGETQLGKERFTWRRGDTFTVPTWAYFTHKANEDAQLFEMSDEPLMRFGLYYRTQVD